LKKKPSHWPKSERFAKTRKKEGWRKKGVTDAVRKKKKKGQTKRQKLRDPGKTGPGMVKCHKCEAMKKGKG